MYDNYINLMYIKYLDIPLQLRIQKFFDIQNKQDYNVIN